MSSQRSITQGRTGISPTRTRVLPRNREMLPQSGHAGSVEPLNALAERVGIQTAYTDMAGRRQRAAPETLKQLLRFWGLQVDRPSDIRDALRTEERREWREVLPPATICWDHHPCTIEVRLPASSEQLNVNCRLVLENGDCRSVDWEPQRLRSQAAARIDGTAYVSLQLPLPSLPFGYHRLELQLADRVHECFIISAPTASYSPADRQKNWGLFLPLYAAHSEQSWGAGNLTDWTRLCDFAAMEGGQVVATLPLLASFLEAPLFEPSPYSPASRLFWNEFYLDVAAAPEFSRCRAAQKLTGSKTFQNQLERFRREQLIQYEGQMALRRQVLELLADHFFKHGTSKRQGEFQQFLLHRPAVLDYAEFRATCEQSGSCWHKWDQRMRHGKLQPGDYSQRAKNYHLYVQWLAEEQVTALAHRCEAKGLSLYLDLPVGVHPDGYDTWRYNSVFASEISVGAPPDPYFPKGQNWGFPPVHPERVRRQDYRYLIEMLRFQMRHAGWLRIDHVLGFHRQYWIPAGLAADQGAYVRYPEEEYYAMLCLEAHRNKVVIVGENLGTVPPEVNESMARHHFRQTYVLQYEQRPDPKRAVRRPPQRSVASINTHDMPPFAAHWSGADIRKRIELDLFPKAKARPEGQSRRSLTQALVEFLSRKGLLQVEGSANFDSDCRPVLKAVMEWLGGTEAELVLFNLEDLWCEQEWQNVPGTSAEHPNWRRKSKLSLEQIFESNEVHKLLAKVRQQRGQLGNSKNSSLDLSAEEPIRGQKG